MIFELKKPNLSKIVKGEKSLEKLFSQSGQEIFNFIKETSEKEYLYWDKVRFKEPSPNNIGKDELWFFIKFIRDSRKIKSIIRDKKGSHFFWSKLSYFEEFFHELDMNTGGELFVEKSDVYKKNKQKLITRGIMEEAIASSQLEGAATSRQAAKKMLREGRKPINKSEQMILNSYLAMKQIEDEYKNRELSLSLLKELHALITDKTLDSEDESPRFRKDGDPICVSDNVTGEIYHEGPSMKFVKKELESLIKFANDQSEGPFIHPVIKAIMLHFWIGYLHPFTDGNGRIARLLFYWYLMKRGYWAFAYLPISKVIKKSPNEYIMAYVYSEQDDNDLTYFIDYNIRKIKLAVREFLDYLDNQIVKNSKMKHSCEDKYSLNMRQVQLLQYLYGDSDAHTSLLAHMNVNQISRKTANNDLKDLLRKDFLRYIKRGRNVYYYGSDKINNLFL